MAAANTLNPQSAKTNSDLLADIRKLIASDFLAVNQLITEQLYSPIRIIEEIGRHIIDSGGKRLRPMIVLLCAKMFNYSGDGHIQIAAIIEFIHTATLLHDDVVDSSQLRRGKKTANAIWGNEASVLVGDFLLSRAFQMMNRLQDPTVLEILADTTNVITEGEALQLMNRHNPATTELQYLEIIRCKTSKLFEAAAQLGAVISHRAPEERVCLAAFGIHFGNAFQIIDDVLDYSGSVQDTGKNIGDDLAEGKPTLPLIYAMQNGTTKQTQLIHNAIKQGGLENLNEIIDAIQNTRALHYAKEMAKRETEYACKLLKQLPSSIYQSMLINLTQFASQRIY